MIVRASPRNCWTPWKVNQIQVPTLRGTVRLSVESQRLRVVPSSSSRPRMSTQKLAASSAGENGSGGEHYRSVVATPEGSDHGNIRALIQHGLAGVKFTTQPLTRR